jgi:hypothetical protein
VLTQFSQSANISTDQGLKFTSIYKRDALKVGVRVGVGRTCSVLARREERFQIGVIAAIKYLAK